MQHFVLLSRFRSSCLLWPLFRAPQLSGPHGQLSDPAGRSLAPSVLLWRPGSALVLAGVFSVLQVVLWCPRTRSGAPARPRTLLILFTRPFSLSGLGFHFAGRSRRSRCCRLFEGSSRGRVAWWNVIECFAKSKLLYSPPDRLSNRAGCLFSRPK
jgi:hypothetical protein